MLILIPTFPAHGRCTFTVDSNIIIIDTLGPWNLEFFEILHSNLKQTVQENFKYYYLLIFMISINQKLTYLLSYKRQNTA
jgi:hypothetical protein